MKGLKNKLLKWLIDDEMLWEICGNIAERFYDKENGMYDYLQEKLYYWFSTGLFT